MKAFDYYRPSTYNEAFALLSTPGRAMMPLAGGTDLIPHVRDDAWKPDGVVDIKGLPGLRELGTVEHQPCCGMGSGACLRVGAAMRMNDIGRSELVRSSWEALAEAAAAMGNEQVRNRATLGGNMGTASPAGDSLPALLVLEATVLVNGPEGERCVPATEFFLGPGRTRLRQSEIITGVLIPQPPTGARGTYEKLSRRKAGDLSIVSVAAAAVPTEGRLCWRIALGAVAPTPIRAPQAEAVLNHSTTPEAIAEAARLAFNCCSPIDDIRASAEYRHAMVIELVQRAVQTVLTRLEPQRAPK